MNKWYKSNIIKGLLSFLVCVSLVAAAVSGVCIVAGLGNNVTWNDISNNAIKNYTQSDGFVETLNQAESDVLSQIYFNGMFETDGKYDGNKLVDIKTYTKDGSISGKNTSGFAYTIDQLASWWDTDKAVNSDIETVSVEGKTIVVCQKPDGTYHYYYFQDFKNLINEKKLNFNFTNSEYTSADDLFYAMEYDMFNSDYSSRTVILDDANQMVYEDFWTILTYVPESYAPDGASSLLDIANENPDWNGHLSDMFSDLENTANEMGSLYSEYRNPSHDFSEGNSNLAYLLVDHKNKTVHTNRAAYNDYTKATDNLEALKKLGAYVLITPDLKGFETNLDTTASAWQLHTIGLDGSNTTDDFTFAVGVDTKFPIQDSFYASNQSYQSLGPYLLSFIILAVISLILFVVAIIWLTAIAGRNTKNDALHLNAFDKIWTELAAAIVICLWILPVCTITWSYDGYYLQQQPGYFDQVRASSLILVGIAALFTALCFLIGWLSLVRRIKGRTLWKNSLLRKICYFIVYICKRTMQFAHDFWANRKLGSRVIIASVVLTLLHFFAGVYGSYLGWPVFLVLIVDIAIAVYLFKQAVTRDKLKTGIREISEGNVDYKIDTTNMKGNDLEVATLINNIGNGLSAAVSKSMKDERMKTDLITNVSHDIKTPLTSIINYVDLLKRENFTDPKVVGYIEVLEQKAQRLKNLTEDVVEASKVSSGNITLEMMNINLVEMINQIDGEYIEKFESRKLEVVKSLPEEPVVIHADGRRLSRILDNIFGNAFKYAMEGTRIYSDLKFKDGNAEFSLKNISAQALNISADELTERFIRGDVARTTEGSGLGLSIAKSLTELQGGTFSLYLDGDLFKVTVIFPLAK